MTIKEIKNHYEIYRRDGSFRIHSKTEGGRMVRKFLCVAHKKGNSFYVDGFKPTTKIERFIEQVNEKIVQYKYDSEYYYPDYVEGVAETIFIHDYMTKLGFRIARYGEGGGDDSYIFDRKNVFGGQTTDIHLSFLGLSRLGEKSKMITICLSTGCFSYTSLTVGNNFDDLKDGIDSILKPLLLTEGIRNVDLVKDLEIKNANFINNISNNLNIYSEDYRNQLKDELLKIIELL
jgi:hypothetical protein